MERTAQLPSTPFSNRQNQVAAANLPAVPNETDAVRDGQPGAGLTRGIVAGLAVEMAAGLGLYAIWLGWHLLR